MSSEPVLSHEEWRESAALSAEFVAAPWGPTPVLSLFRAEAPVFAKHEGFGPSGSMFDRVVRFQLAESSPSRCVIDGGDAYAVAAARACAILEVPLDVVVSGDSWRRVEKLLRVYGARVHVSSAEDRRRIVDEAVSDGALELVRHDVRAVLAAYREVASEVRRAGLKPKLWVVVDYGATMAQLRNALGADAGVMVETVADDGERRRQLDGPSACRRVQMGHREGILLSPIGADLVDLAINAAHEIDGSTCVVLPEGGNRYLGWW